ncbi:MAG: hypothetical protein Q4G45_06445 [Actinomycetia bacterium]|nr:hypothetical protein [Actinomycetes bacterium]
MSDDLDPGARGLRVQPYGHSSGPSGSGGPLTRRRARLSTAALSGAVALALATAGCNPLASGQASPSAGSSTVTPSSVVRTLAPSSASDSPTGPRSAGTTAATSARSSGRTSSASPSQAVTVAASDTLTTQGIGGVRLHAPVSTLVPNQYAVPLRDENCAERWKPGPALERRGISFHLSTEETLVEIILRDGTHTTESGAKVGMTFAQVKKIYGDRGRLETKKGVGGQHQVFTVASGGREVAFMADQEKPSVADTDTVGMIILQDYRDSLGFAGC